MAQLAYAISTEKEINVASVPHRSPFRYPGGKTWLVPYIRLWLKASPRRYAELIEPFAGGGIVGLSAAFEGLADRVTLVELDPDIAAVWRTILGKNGRNLAELILAFEPTERAVKALLQKKQNNLLDRAFSTIVRNRVQRGGILAPGAGLMKQGENGRGLASRWYPETLHRRILEIISIKDRVRFVEGDGLAYIQSHARRTSSAFFVDPPYTVAGRRLYRFSNIDHRALFTMLSKVSGNVLMTYDDCSEIRHLTVEFGFESETAAMKNTHNTSMSELLVSNDLSWLFRPAI